MVYAKCMSLTPGINIVGFTLVNGVFGINLGSKAIYMCKSQPRPTINAPGQTSKAWGLWCSKCKKGGLKPDHPCFTAGG
ncbi:MAG: hypothetical protein MJA29_08970 [Candidatus Omnitrophica bacterium]|nr:hypothetical protein [Candidatus Omnitrophota bacterium]